MLSGKESMTAQALGPPLHKGGFSLAQCLGRHTALPRWETELSWLYPLGPGRDSAWGAKKVGEKLSFSPRARGGVTYRPDGYFAEGQNNTPPMPEIPFRISGSLHRSEDSGSNKPARSR